MISRFFNTSNMRCALIVALQLLKMSVNPFSKYFHFKKNNGTLFGASLLLNIIFLQVLWIFRTKCSTGTYFVQV